MRKASVTGTWQHTTYMKMIGHSNPKLFFLAGVFLICTCILMMQINRDKAFVRNFLVSSCCSVYQYAMFGMTAGSLFVYLKEGWFPSEHLFEDMVWICSLQRLDDRHLALDTPPALNRMNGSGKRNF